MANKNLFTRIKEVFVKPEPIDKNALALASLSSKEAFMKFLKDFQFGTTGDLSYELPNGRELFCVRENIPNGSIDDTYAGGYLIDNDGTRIDLVNLHHSAFGSPESIIEGAYMYKLKRNGIMENSFLSRQHGIVEALVNKSFESGEDQTLNMPNGQKLVFQLVPDDGQTNVGVSIALYNKENLLMEEMLTHYKAKDADHPAYDDGNYDNLATIQRYYDKVSEIRSGINYRNRVEDALNMAVDMQTTLSFNLPNGKKLEFEPVKLEAVECDYLTARIYLTDEKGQREMIMFEEKLPEHKNIDELLTTGTVANVQAYYDKVLKEFNGLDEYISEKASMQTEPKKSHGERIHGKEDEMIA